MIIVYISLALFIGSIIYLAFFAFKTFKDTKPTIENVNQTVTRIQAKTDQIKSETDQLAMTQQEITEDVEYKKRLSNIRLRRLKKYLNPLRIFGFQ